MSDVTIIGAGVAGLWAARSCLARGLTPRLIDRAGPPGPHGCSWWAGGMLAPECEGATAGQLVVIHGRGAADLWADVTRVTRNGTLVLAPERDRRELDRFAARTDGQTACDAAAIAALEPDLAGHHRRGLFFAAEAHLDPRLALADLARTLSDAGVVVEAGEAEPATLSGPVIDCRGLAAADDLPGLRGVRGEMIVLHSDEITLSRPVRLLHPRHPLYVVPRAGGLFMLGATQIESAARGRVTARSALELLSAAYALDPRFAEAEIVEMGADLRPAFADHLPRVLRRGHILHLNGLFRHGFLMAPALAEQAAEYLSTGKTGDLFDED
jgi:glycine oxidase